MMRMCSVVMLALLFAATMCSAAGMAGRPYAGGGILYSYEEFTGDNSDIDFGNTWGAYLKGGYFVTENIAVEGLYRYHNEWEGDVENVRVTLKANDLTVNGKYYFPMEQIMPYAVFGVGYIQFKADNDLAGTGSDTESGPLARGGVGCDYFFDDNIGVELEGTYNMGFQDVDDGNFFDVLAGVIFAF
jgi:outer membrane protein W